MINDSLCTVTYSMAIRRVIAGNAVLSSYVNKASVLMNAINTTFDTIVSMLNDTEYRFSWQ